MSFSNVYELTSSLYQHFDGRNSALPPVAVMNGETKSISCGAGCYYCCHIEVGVCASEVLTVKRAIEALPRRSAEKIKSAIRHRRREIGNSRGEERKASRLLCPLLNDERLCSVHAGRPLACRAWVSFDRRSCQDDYERPMAGVEVPYSGTLGKYVDDLVPQIAKYEAALGIVPGAYELVRALHIAFSIPDVERRCLRGEAVFAEATLLGR